MSDFQSAITQLESTYNRLFALIDAYPVSKRELSGACGIWSPKQVLAHLSGWIVLANKRYDDFAAGDPRNLYYDVDPVNARSVAERAHRSWDETVTELKTRITAFIQRARALPGTMPAQDVRFQEWQDGLREDCAEHIEQLEAFSAKVD